MKVLISKLELHKIRLYLCEALCGGAKSEMSFSLSLPSFFSPQKTFKTFHFSPPTVMSSIIVPLTCFSVSAWFVLFPFLHNYEWKRPIFLEGGFTRRGSRERGERGSNPPFQLKTSKTKVKQKRRGWLARTRTFTFVQRQPQLLFWLGTDVFHTCGHINILIIS